MCDAYIDIYIWYLHIHERERERDIYIYIDTHINVCCKGYVRLRVEGENQGFKLKGPLLIFSDLLGSLVLCILPTDKTAEF